MQVIGCLAQHNVVTYTLVFFAALITTIMLVPVATWLSRRWDVLAVPGGRRQHAGLIPKLGGVALMGGLATAVALIYLLIPPDTPDDARRLQGVALGTIVFFIGGIIDDRWELSAKWQFAIQFVGAVVAIGHIVFIEVFTNPFAGTAVWEIFPLNLLFRVENDLIWMWRPLALLFTLFWIVGMINAVNMLDGLDGLAAGVGTIAAVMFAWHGYKLGQTAVVAFPLALAGALLGFLVFNFAPAKIFLGSAGAYILGYQLATLSILSPAKLSTALLVLAVPILDVAWQIASRIRRGQNPFQGDRGHLHFRLSDGGLPTRQIVLGYYAVSLAFGLTAILLPNGLLKIGVLVGLTAVVFAILIWLGQRQKIKH